MSNEEVAYFLYLKRHQVVKTRELQERETRKRIDVIKHVLRDTIVNNNQIYQKQAQ